MAVLTRRLLLGGLLGATALTASGASPRTPLPTFRPHVLACADWGADPPAEAPVLLPRRPKRIIVHHTATDNATDRSLDHARRLALFFQREHVRRGWGDTGQHFTSTRGGVLLEGRHGTLAVLDAGDRMVEGAHCVGQNRESIGIENEGLYTDRLPTAPQWAALVWLCARVCERYGIEPTGIDGHRDHWDGTVCPGDALHAGLPLLRAHVAALLEA
ncbi:MULTISPECIES: peptidoglycan recognition family protein [Actinosynnema]|uniref:peptidoglycan recognition protein family protein n=1 Tax=Actinosynnema TaxID=40566 RepID=UPI0020A4E96E|nr:peptidoglycan recognition family protein [Actinosynnema pretiosum]MCP2099430.1 N-acetylmuramoyl-L-alanine amidase [Actinosynnema pretiosum]